MNEEVLVVEGLESTFGFHATCSLSTTSQSVNKRYYLSNDTLLDVATDLLLSSETINISNGQVSYGQAENLTASPRHNYLILVVNYSRTFTETDYSNNIAIAKLKYELPTYDISIGQFYTNDYLSQIQGNSIRLLVNTQNTGNVPVYSKYKIFQSLDTLFGSDDQELFYKEGSYELSRNSTSELGIHDVSETSDFLGKVNFILVADPENEYTESNEKNNTKVLTFDFQKEDFDVSADSLKIQESYHSAGAIFNLNLYFSNKGKTPAGQNTHACKIRYFISADAKIDLKDSLIAIDSVYVPKPGELRSITLKSYLPKSYQSLSKVYCLAAFNYDSTLSTDNFNNNVAKKEIILSPPLPDVKVTLDFPLFRTPGFIIKPAQTFSISHYIHNQGTDTAAVAVDYYFSKDSLLNAGDSLLVHKNWGVIQPRVLQEWREVELFESFPYPEGRYYIIVVENAGKRYKDRSPSNDTISVPLLNQSVFLPELTFEFTAVDRQRANRGDTVFFRYYVYPVGDFPAPPKDKLYTHFYLSKNRGLDAGDTFLGKDLYQFGDRHNSFTVPSDWEGDSLFFIIFINKDRLFQENFFDNNIAVQAIKVGSVITETAPEVKNLNPLVLYFENNTIYLEGEEKVDYQLMDGVGKAVRNGTAIGNITSLDFLAPGLYYLKAASKERSGHLKFLK